METTKEEEEPDFGGDEKDESMKPKENFFVPGGTTSDGEGTAPMLILPTAKARSKSIPPQPRSKSRNRVSSKSALRSRSRLPDRSPPRDRSRARPRGRSGSGPIRPLEDRKLSPRRGPRVVIDHRPIHQTPSAPVNSKAAFLRKVSEMKIEGWALVNCHLGSYYYDDSNWSLTHPRQLSSLSLRRDAELENRWLCWQCNMPVEGVEPHDTAKTSFKTPVEQCYHWWQMHAGESHWEWIYEAIDLNVTLPEVMFALGINIDEVPFPLGTALEGGRIPRCIPSRPWKLHDPRVFGAPWWRKKTHPSARSEQGLPWTPVPPSYPPPSALQPSGASKSNAPYPPQSTARPKPTPKPAPKPPVESKKETEKKVAENQEKIKAAKEKGFPIMPKAENSTTFTVTDMGWVDPLELYYGAVADELQKLCAGHSSVGSYGQSRCNFHKKHFGVSRMAEEFLRLEEHAFYLLVFKLAATHAMTTPESLSTELRAFLGEALEFANPVLQRLIKDYTDAEATHRSLSSEAYFKDIVNYIYQVIVLQVPVSAKTAPRAPGEEGKLCKSEQAALLM